MDLELQTNSEASLPIPNHFKPPLKLKLICGYLYFIQGVVLALPATMPLIYDKLPPYSVLSLFSAAYLPFSFKFLEGITDPIKPHSSKSSPAFHMGNAKRGS